MIFRCLPKARAELTTKPLLGCSFIPGTNSFRTAWAIQFIPCVFLLAGLPFLPRSPRWLAKVGRVDEAIEILARIQAGGDVNDPLVVAEWEEITTILAAERGKKSPGLPSVRRLLSWCFWAYPDVFLYRFPIRKRNIDSQFWAAGQQGWRRFVKNGMWKRTFAGMSVQAWQQLSGANVCLHPVDGWNLYLIHSTGYDILRRLYFRYGGPNRKHRSHFLRHPIRHFHHRHSRHVLFHRCDRSQASSHLRSRWHGHLHVCCRRCVGLLWHDASERSQWKCQCQGAGQGTACKHRHRFLLSPRAYIFHHLGAHRLGLRR